MDQPETAEGQDHRLGEAANFTKSTGLLPAVLCMSTEESLEMKLRGVDAIDPVKEGGSTEEAKGKILCVDFDCPKLHIIDKSCC